MKTPQQLLELAPILQLARAAGYDLSGEPALMQCRGTGIFLTASGSVRHDGVEVSDVHFGAFHQPQASAAADPTMTVAQSAGTYRIRHRDHEGVVVSRDFELELDTCTGQLSMSLVRASFVMQTQPTK